METETCYICYNPETEQNTFVKNPLPCSCRGSILIHTECFKELLKTSRNCSICKNKYNTYYLPNKNGLELITDVSENGYVREYTVNTNGCKEGEEIILNPSGEICSKSVYTNGLLNGLYQTWHSNGRLEYQCHCINNRLEGILSRWYENGQIAEQSNYRDGLKEGESILWNKTGSMRKSIQYKNGAIMS